MGTTVFPTQIDTSGNNPTFADHPTGTNIEPEHMNNVQAAIIAIQSKLGVGAYADTIHNLIINTSTVNPGHKHDDASLNSISEVKVTGSSIIARKDTGSGQQNILNTWVFGVLAQFTGSGTAINVTNNVTIGGTATIATNTLATGGVLHLAKNTTGARAPKILFAGDDTYGATGSLIIQRDTTNSPNAFSQFIHRGTADLQFTTQDAASIRFKTTNIERVSISSTGKVGIGFLSSSAPVNSTALLGILEDQVTAIPMLITEYRNNGSGGQMMAFYRGRGDKLAVAAINSGDELGILRWSGRGSSAMLDSAEIKSIAGSNFTTSGSSDIRFLTRSIFDAAPQTRCTITQNGAFGFGVVTPTSFFDISNDYLDTVASHYMLRSYYNVSGPIGPKFALRRGTGSKASPAAIIANDYLGSFEFHGYTGPSPLTTSVGAEIRCDAASGATWDTITNSAARLQFLTKKAGTSLPTRVATLSDTGNFGVGDFDPIYEIHVQRDANNARLALVRFQNSEANLNELQFRRGRGTAASRLAVAQGDVLGSIGAYAQYGTDSFDIDTGIRLSFIAEAAPDFPTLLGTSTKLSITTRDLTAHTSAVRFEFLSDGLFRINDSVQTSSPPGTGLYLSHLNGLSRIQSLRSGSATDIAFETNSSGTSTTERMRIKSTGEVGINISSGSIDCMLTVGGIVRLANTTLSATPGSNQGLFLSSGLVSSKNECRIQAYAPGAVESYLSLFTNLASAASNEKLRIQANGYTGLTNAQSSFAAAFDGLWLGGYVNGGALASRIRSYHSSGEGRIEFWTTSSGTGINIAEFNNIGLTIGLPGAHSEHTLFCYGGYVGISGSTLTSTPAVSYTGSGLFLGANLSGEAFIQAASIINPTSIAFHTCTTAGATTQKLIITNDGYSVFSGGPSSLSFPSNNGGIIGAAVWTNGSTPITDLCIAAKDARGSSQGYIRFYTANGGTTSERMQIDNLGWVGFNTSPTDLFAIKTLTGVSGRTVSITHTNDTTEPMFDFRRGTGSLGATGVAHNEQVMRLRFNGWDGSAYQVGSEIRGYCVTASGSGNWGASDRGGNISIFTTPAGAGSPASTRRMTVLHDGKVGIGSNVDFTALLDISSDVLRLRSAKTPASANASGNQGDICWDGNFIYVCTATSQWKRASLLTWV